MVVVHLFRWSWRIRSDGGGSAPVLDRRGAPVFVGRGCDLLAVMMA
jgi:hypothetical protein